MVLVILIQILEYKFFVEDVMKSLKSRGIRFPGRNSESLASFNSRLQKYIMFLHSRIIKKIILMKMEDFKKKED